MAVALFGGNDLILIDGAQVDVKTGEYHSYTAAPTSFAIENGSVAADHIVEVPDVLEISWVMSNIDDNGSSYGNRAANLLDALHKRIKARKLWQVVTRHKLYPSMAVVAVTAEHIGPFSGALRGRVAFQEIPLDKLERTRLPEPKTKRKGAATQVNSGRVEGKTPTDADKKKANTSFIKQIFNKGNSNVNSAGQ